MNILFICTHNACRSILAEVIARQLSNGRLSSASAGSNPAGRIHPLTLKYLIMHGYSTEGLSSKSWEEAVQNASPDIIITVCDQAAGDACPIALERNTIKGHWGLPDPSHLADNSRSETEAFALVIGTIESRIRLLLSEPIEEMGAAALQALINRVGDAQ